MVRRPVREIPFTDIEREFDVAGASYWWLDGKYRPAVVRKDTGDYSIRVVKSETRSGSSVHTTYDYFTLSAEGLVLVAPRGFAKDYKPGRVTGLDEAVARYAEPSPDAPRLQL